ncbi:FAD-dependent oxidoreductase [Roseomonas populi]|uniref:FAD-dependent oxidoreductase n=1 Tax=Roseomonas populi TaxID=3121582 RepID=A0ABT1XBT9_9PROT|nr:FAD-dependent oxidoreductase [Roseomonas pecuniae]MCR0985597.1 FAD-dependent oxidoreductase [Roseomonas pecuniae]
MYDVVVAGGGAAGIGAALGAAAAGARVLLLERYGFLGGAATNAGVLTYCGLYQAGETPRRAVGGAADRLLAGLAALGGEVAPIRSRSGNWIVPFDPEALKHAADQAVVEAGVECRLHALVTGAARAGASLEALRVTDHAGTAGIAARAFVDASGEATLAVLAGVPRVVPQPDGQVQPGSATMRVGGLPPDAMPGREVLARVAARANAMLHGTPVRPDGGVFMPMLGAGEAWWMCVDLPTDGLTAESLTLAETAARRAAWAVVAALREEPGLGGAHLLSTGPQFGVRETRRCAARAEVTGAAVAEGRRDPAGVARGAWPMEVHEAPGRASYTPVGGKGFYDIPLDTLRAQGADNLWYAGRVAGADRAAYGSTRVMGTAFATGQAAGVAAALGGDAATARAELLRQGAIL